MSFDMKPCPFCGGDDQELSCGESGSDPKGEWVTCAINCRDCGALGPWIDLLGGATPREERLAEAAKEWNERAQIDCTCARDASACPQHN